MQSRLSKQTLAAGLIGIVIGAAALGAVWAEHGSGGHVRVAGRVLNDGAVEVAVQQQQDGEWGERQKPDARFIPADADRGRWYNSTAVGLAAAEAGPRQLGRTHELGPFQFDFHVFAARPVTTDTLFCLFGHGDPNDGFWRSLFQAASTSAQLYGIQLRAGLYPDGADQAAAIEQCVADSAVMIATSLADPDALAPAMRKAREAGVRLITFNSGHAQADGLGSMSHFHLDEGRVGVIAAQEFVRRGVDGDILCVIHERVNVGLEERCDALDADYDRGEVIRLNVAGADDVEAAIAQAVSGDVSAVLTLNFDTTVIAVDALHTRTDLVIGAVGADMPVLPALIFHELVHFGISDGRSLQGYLAIPLMMMQHGVAANRESGPYGQMQDIVITPRLMTKANVVQLRAGPLRQHLPRAARLLDQAIADVGKKYNRR